MAARANLAELPVLRQIEQRDAVCNSGQTNFSVPSIVFGMDPDPRPHMRRTTCPKCHSTKALITTMSFGGDHGCYCPDCGHSWDCQPGSAPMPAHFARVVT